MIVVGIDPGLDGAICRMHDDTERVWDMPTHEVVRNGKARRQLNAEALALLLGLDVFDAYDGDKGQAIAFVEAAQASTQMGVSSAFAYGVGFGLVLGVLAHLGVPVVLVSPARWKKRMGIAKKGSRELGEEPDKRSALDLARALYPRLGEQLALKKHDGRAEAVLLAHYGWEQLEEKGDAA